MLEPLPSRGWVAISSAGGVLAVLVGLVMFALSWFIGDVFFPFLFYLEPLAIIGASVVLSGLLAVCLGLLIGRRRSKATLETAIRQRDDFQRMLKDSTGQLDSAREELQEVTRRWGDVTRRSFQAYRHDLVRPFERIRDKEKALSAIRSSGGSISDSDIASLLQEIGTQSEAFYLMMANVQALIEVEGPTFSTRAESLRPKAIVQRVVDQYKGVLDATGKRLSHYSDPDEFGLVQADGTVIQHVITNLVDNALKFADANLQIRLTRNEREFYISVWDDGPGIPPEEYPHIFERGWTREASQGRLKTSAGLGLFISRTLAERAGGTLLVESGLYPNDAGSGTTFVLGLPSAP